MQSCCKAALTLNSKDEKKIFVMYFYHAGSVLGQGEYWKHYFEMVFPKLISLNVDFKMLQAQSESDNQKNTSFVKITPGASNEVEQVIMVEQTPNRPTPEITTADKSTPAKLHETLQEKVNELKGTPITPQVIMKKYLMKTKDRLVNSEESIISVIKTQNK